MSQPESEKGRKSGEPPFGNLSAFFDSLSGLLPRDLTSEDLLLCAVMLILLSGEKKNRTGLLCALVYLLLSGGSSTPDGGCT